MDAYQVEKIREEIRDFVDAVCELSKVNRLTGIWDNRRFQECKKPIEQADLAYVYKSEKLSRKNVELRGIHRKRIDCAFANLLKYKRMAQKGNA